MDRGDTVGIEKAFRKEWSKITGDSNGVQIQLFKGLTIAHENGQIGLDESKLNKAIAIAEEARAHAKAADLALAQAKTDQSKSWILTTNW